MTKDILDGHAIWNKYKSYWKFLSQSYEGGIDYTGAFVVSSQSPTSLWDSVFRVFANGQEIDQTPKGNLFMHPKERTKDYQERARMSYYYNFCAPIVDIYTNHLFKQSPVEDFQEIENEIETVYEDIDSKGSSIPEFRRELAEVAQVYGHCYVVVDSPNLSGEDIYSMLDQIEKRAFPYLMIYSPLQVINWSLDKFGNPYWILCQEQTDANIDPLNYEKKSNSKPIYRLWTRNKWYLFDDEMKVIAEGIHDLGVVPIVCVFDKRSKLINNFLGVSSLADISFIARDIYNSCSELKQILRDQTFAFLAIQGSSEEYSELSTGTSKGLLYPENRNVPQYVSPPSANAEVYFTHIDRQVSKIFQLAKLEGGSAQFKSQNAIQESGVSKAWDFNETNSSLTNKASNLEDAEMKILKIFGLWLGKNFTGNVAYPKEFSVSKLADDMTEAEQSAKLSLGKTFQLEVLKTIQKKKFPSASESDLQVMEDEALAELDKKTNEMQPTNGSLKSRMPFLFNQNANSAANGG